MGASSNDTLAAFLSKPGEALRELDRIDCEESLSAFIKRSWHQIEPATAYKHGWHIDAISEHLEAVTDGYIQKLLINVPPGTLKSISCSVMYPAWEWGPRGFKGMRYIGTSYSERYSLRDNMRTLSLVSSEWYQERWPIQLISNGAKKFENIEHGWREAIPFNSLTAGRADRLIIDDPHSTETAESDKERESTLRIFLESVPTRLNDPEKSAIIIIMQRLHEEDVSGAAISRELGYTHLNLPMEYDPSRHCTTYYPGTDTLLFDDPRKEDGELLFPDRFPRKVVENYKHTMGSYAYSGQMQQMPVPRGGGIFKYEWWQDWGNPDDWDDPAFKSFPAMDYVVASLDGAYTEKEENDYSALTVWGVFYDDGRIKEEFLKRQDKIVPEHYLAKELPGLKDRGQTRMQQRSMTESPKIMLLSAWQARLTLNALVEKVAQTCKSRRVNKLLIEGKGPGISVAQEIRRLHSGNGWGVQLIDPGRSDKVARAYAVQPLFEDQMIYAPKWPPREWVETVKDQMANFPKGSHDDLTDSATQALNHLRQIGLAVHEAEVERDYQEQVRYKGRPPAALYPT